MPLPSITPKHQDVEVDGVGTLRMRALTFGELRAVQERLNGEDPLGVLEAVPLALKLAIEGDPAETEAWALNGDSHLVQEIFGRIMKLSGRDGETEAALGN